MSVSGKFLGAFFKDRATEGRTGEGTPFKRQARADGTAEATYGAVIKRLAQSDFPAIQTQGGTAYQPNVYELNPLTLTCLDPEADLVPNDYLTFPADGDDAKDRYRVESMNPVYVAGTLAYYTALIFAAPDTE